MMCRKHSLDFLYLNKHIVINKEKEIPSIVYSGSKQKLLLLVFILFFLCLNSLESHKNFGFNVFVLDYASIKEYIKYFLWSKQYTIP